MFFTDDPLLVFIEKKAKLFRKGIPSFKRGISFKGMVGGSGKFSKSEFTAAKDKLSPKQRYKAGRAANQRPNDLRKEVIEDKPKRPTASRNLGDSLRLAALRKRNESI